MRDSYTDTTPSEDKLPSYAVAVICAPQGNAGRAVIAIGIFRRSTRVTSFSRRYEISTITALRNPVGLDRIFQEIPSQNKHHFSQAMTEKRALPEGTSEAFIRVLSQNADNAAELIERASGFSTRLSQMTPERRALLAEEKDTFGLIADLTGLGRDARSPGHRLIMPTDPVDPSRTFLESTRLGYNDEEALIEFDMARFDGVLGERARRNARGMIIRHPGGTLTVLNTNNRDLEHTKGCDLIYYNVDRQSGLLIQYKRMRKENDYWVYRGDGQLRQELERMRSVKADSIPAGVAQYRLNTEPRYLKVVRPTDYDGRSAELMKGLYLPLSLVDLMGRSPDDITKEGNLRITWDDERWPTQRHLNNSGFTQLFRDGWIGSCGTTSEEIRAWIEPLFDADELITIAIVERTDESDE